MPLVVISLIAKPVPLRVVTAFSPSLLLPQLAALAVRIHNSPTNHSIRGILFSPLTNPSKENRVKRRRTGRLTALFAFVVLAAAPPLAAANDPQPAKGKKLNILWI